mmetsp:Transcript_10739/g.23618  ORF Transcript_10739/g.23618 Transcript_10739/m.23618 type:complete len:105 (+) Transcript_10739:341-655(+)
MKDSVHLRDSSLVGMTKKTVAAIVMTNPVVLEHNELLEVVEKAWTPSVPRQDPNGYAGIRYDWVSRWVAPAHDDDEYKSMKEYASFPFGPKLVLFRSQSIGLLF